MDEQAEDKSEESRKKHIRYYQSLSKIIENIQKEIESEKEEKIINHLKERITAINLDKERIEKIFPEGLEELKDE